MRGSSSAKRSSSHNGSKRRSPRFETLENRLLLAAQLADDRFDVFQNSGERPLDVLFNDTFSEDYSGDRLITSVSYGSEGGRVDIAEDGKSIQYTPPADFAGPTETFHYYVDGQYSATVTVAVHPLLRHDSYDFPPDGQTRTLDVLANDPFWEGYDGPGRITSTSEALLWGDLQIAPDGKSLTYTPPDGRYGKDAFVYIVDDLYPAQVKIDILDPLESDQYPDIVQRSENHVLDVLANDPFWWRYPGQRKITHVVAPSDGGTVTIIDGGKRLLYTPAPDFAGSERFRYVVDGTYETTVGLLVHRPVQDDRFELDINSSDYPLMVTPNDIYKFRFDGHDYTRDVIDRVTSVGETTHGGTVKITADGQGIIYTAPAGFEGTDSFEYIADGKHPATVEVHLTRPVRDDSLRWNINGDRICEDTVGHVLDVLSNDFRGNGYQGPKLITAVSESSEGGIVTIAAAQKTIIYTPPADFRGTDTFHYTVDGTLQAEVEVRVGTIIVFNRYSLLPDPAQTQYALHVLRNDHFDSYYPGSGLITNVSETENGSLAVIAGGGTHILFTRTDGSPDYFTYTVDGKYETSVSVKFKNFLRGDSYRVDQNSQANRLTPLENDFERITDAWKYQGPRRITSVGPTDHGGIVSVVADGTAVTYSPSPDFVGTDRFTYTVDGLMERTISVNVTRRVRDDVYRVEPDEGTNVLPVLVNDLFGADYIGAGRITAVTATDAGATATVSTDGRSIEYVSPDGFSGKDHFIYTVDGTWTAEVTVWTVSSVEEVIPRFDSLTEFKQSLLDDALIRYESLFGLVQPFGQVFFAYPGEWDMVTTLGGAEGADRVYSETNVQVDGVDEADIIETDGDNLYILTDHELIIAEAWPAEDLAISSRVTIEGDPIGEYLHGDRLTVISQTSDDPWLRPFDPMEPSFIVADRWWPMPRNLDTWVTVFDVSDRESPVIVERTKLDGTHVQTRRIDDSVFVVLRDHDVDNWLPQPERTHVDDSYVYETRQEYIDRMALTMEDFLPHWTSYGDDGELLGSGLLHATGDIFMPPSPDARQLVTVVSLDISDEEPGVAASTAIFTTGASAIYGSLDKLYIFDQQYNWEDGAVTEILAFNWNAETASVDFSAKGQVPGRMLNQFSADDDGGYLRIATTINNSYSGNWSRRSENVLFVLRDDAGVLEFVGGMQNLALEETIRSVRFMGSRAFITTFRTIDPLFVVDLADPANPKPRGHITMPGFNSYMQLIDENHLLTIGRNTPMGNTGPTQVSLFDVEDITRPRLIDRYTFERFSTSEAETEHHAFGWFAHHNVLAMPSVRVYTQRVDQDGDGYSETRETVREDKLALFTIDVTAERFSGDGIKLLGELDHDSPVRRAAFIDNVLYSVAERSAMAVSIEDPTIVYAEIEFGDPPVLPDRGFVIGPIQIIDDRDPGFEAAGQWSSQADQGFADGMHFRRPGSGQEVATWSFDVAPGQYRVAATWSAFANRATDAPFTVLDGSTPLATVRVDQESTPDDFVQNDIAWENLGTFEVTGNRLVVTLSDDANEYVVADAVRVERIEASPYQHPGDANLDGVTDVRDFMVWNANKFTDGTTLATGDFNDDGVTDVRDFMVWNANKFTSAPAPAPVDEVLKLSDPSGAIDAWATDLAWLYVVDQTDNSTPQPTAESAVDKLLQSYWP